MGTRARPRPKHLAKKLRAIRKKLGLSQSQLAHQLEFDKGAARISEYEHGTREPELTLLLRYARLAGVCTCVLIDDRVKAVDMYRRHSPH